MSKKKVSVIIACHGDVPLDYIEENKEAFEMAESHIEVLSNNTRELPRTRETDPFKHDVEDLIEKIKEKRDYQSIEAGYMSFCGPSIPDAVDNAIKKGAEKVLVIPLFNVKSKHSVVDIPEIVEKAKATNPDADVSYLEPGDDEIKNLLAEILVKKIDKSIGD